MKKIGVLYHPLKEQAVKLAGEIDRFLRAQGLSVWQCSAWEGDTARAKVDGTDLILSIGGDGTILRAAQAVLPGNIPITGINLGMLGFMTELSVTEAKEQIRLLLDGKGWLDERTLLETEVTLPGNTQTSRFFALNDTVVARGATVRVILIEASIDGKPLTTYKADGVIVATATGSTGYALAAGGPILHPHAREMILLPIMPHLSAGFCLVIPPASLVTLRVKTMHPATLSIDGHTNLTIENDTTVTIRRSEHTLKFLRIHPPDSFYSTLEKRLKGKQ